MVAIWAAQVVAFGLLNSFGVAIEGLRLDAPYQESAIRYGWRAP